MRLKEEPVSHLCVLICRVDDDSDPDKMTELHRIDVPAIDPSHLEPETSLDELETQTLTIGQEVMRHLLVSQWKEIDRLLVDHYQQLFPPRERAV